MKLPAAIENLVKRLRGGARSEHVSVERLRAEIDRLKAERNSLEQATRANCQQKLLQEASSPLSQLLLQLYIADRPGSLLTASDVLVHVKRLIAVFEENGMTVVGRPGEEFLFDPNMHEVIAPDSEIRSGSKVVVRSPGLAYGSTLVRKAAVEKQETT